ncbi:TPA: MFS transporter, partial [Raoultella ornithinolytica]
MAVEIMPHDQVRKSIIQGLREVLAGNIAVRPWYAVAAVMIATLMTSYHTRILALMLAELRGVWGLTYDEGAELNTVATALQLLIAPAIPLTAAIVGPRRVLLYCALGFAFLTFITPFMVGIKALLVVHGLTAILLGCFIPATLTVVFRNLPPRFWLLALSFYTLRLTVATYSGVSMAGIYIDELGWHFFYWQQTFFAMVVAGLTVYSLPIEKNIN